MLVRHFLSQFIHPHLQSFFDLQSLPLQRNILHTQHARQARKRRRYCSQTARTADSVICIRRVATVSCCFDKKDKPTTSPAPTPTTPFSKSPLQRLNGVQHLVPHNLRHPNIFTPLLKHPNHLHIVAVPQPPRSADLQCRVRGRARFGACGGCGGLGRRARFGL